MQVTGVLFDMGGTLLSYENREKMGNAFLTAMSDLGIDIKDPKFAAARKQASTEVEKRFSKYTCSPLKPLLR